MADSARVDQVTVWPSWLLDYKICPRLYRNRRFLRLPAHPTALTGSGWLSAANALHAELEKQHAAGEHDHTIPIDLTDPADTADIARWVALHAEWCPSRAHARYIGGERTLAWSPPGERLLLMGRLDALWEFPDGCIEVCDYKTGATPIDLAEDAAAAIYGLLASADWPGRPIRVAYEFLNLPDPQVLTIDADRGFRRAALELVRRHAQAVRGEAEWRTRPGPFCKYCPYQPICPDGDAWAAVCQDGAA